MNSQPRHTADTIVSPFMVYSAKSSNDLDVHYGHEVEMLSMLDPNVRAAVESKIAQKVKLGAPRDKTLDLAEIESTRNLTPDRQAALDITVATLERIAGDTRLYTLAQTAILYANPHQLYSDEFLGRQLYVRVEEGLSVTADAMSTMIEKLGTEAQCTDGIRQVSVEGLKRVIQTRGYELRGGDGSGQFIDGIPACEMYMAAAAIDQSRLGKHVIRILPWYMEDREEAARFATERFASELDSRIETVILGPSGDVKRLFGWHGHRPVDTAALLGDRKAHKAASQIIDQLHGASAAKWAAARNGGKPAHMLFNGDQPPAERFRMFADVPNQAASIFEKPLRPNADREDVEIVLLDMREFLSSIAPRTKANIEVWHNGGINTNSVTTIRMGVNVGRDDGIETLLTTTLIYESANDLFIREAARANVASGYANWLGRLQLVADTESAVLRYVLVEASKK